MASQRANPASSPHVWADNRRDAVLRLSPGRLLLALVLTTAALTAAHLAGRVSAHLGHDSVFGLVPLFDLENEQNVPTIFTSMVLLGCSAALVGSAAVARRQRVYWYGLACVFLCLGVDEVAQLHEPLLFVMKGNVSPGTEALARSMPLRFAQMVPEFVALGLAATGATLAFLGTLPRRSAVLFALAGAIYVTGAVVFDLLTARGAQMVASEAIKTLLRLAEEVFEMLGASLFLFALLDHLSRAHPRVAIELRAPEGAGARTRARLVS